MTIYSLVLLFLSFAKITNERWVWGIFTSGSHALGICMSFVSTRDSGTKHHRLCHRVDQHPGPRCCSECAQLPLQFPSLCPSEHSSTHPSLTLGLRLSSSGRILIFCVMWLQTVCWFPSPWPSWLSGEAVDLLLNAEHTKKQWGTRWLKKCNWWSQQPFLEESLGHLTGSLSLHGFVLGKNKRVLCDLRHKALG